MTASRNSRIGSEEEHFLKRQMEVNLFEEQLGRRSQRVPYTKAGQVPSHPLEGCPSESEKQGFRIRD